MSANLILNKKGCDAYLSTQSSCLDYFTLNSKVIPSTLSSFKTMINYIQLNQNIDKENNKIINDTILEDIHNYIFVKSSTEKHFFCYLYEISISCNVDLRSIVHKYLSFLIKNYPSIADSRFLQSIEIILHRHDIPINIHIDYLFHLLDHN